MNRYRVGAFLLASVLPALACTRVVVVSGPTLLSSKDAKVAVLRQGKPVKDAKVELVASEDWGQVPLPYWSGSTGPDGILLLPYLSPGVFQLRLVSEQEIEATLFFQVHENAPIEGTRSIDFEISPKPPIALNLKDLSATIPIRAFLRAFDGAVADPIGAVIRGAKISVKKRSDPEGNAIAETVTDEEGRFSIGLPAGEYIGIFRSTGFRSELVPFSIGSKGWEALMVKLQLGGGGGDCGQHSSYSTKGELVELPARSYSAH